MLLSLFPRANTTRAEIVSLLSEAHAFLIEHNKKSKNFVKMGKYSFYVRFI